MGKKLGMTQIFDQSGILIPVTLIKLGKCFVSDIKTKENSGYDAIQIAYDFLFCFAFYTIQKKSKYLNRN